MSNDTKIPISINEIGEIGKNISDLVVSNSMLLELIPSIKDEKTKKELEDLYLSFSRNIQNLQDISINLRLVELDSEFTNFVLETSKSSKKVEFILETKNLKIDASVFNSLKPLFKELFNYITLNYPYVLRIFFRAEQNNIQNIFKISFLANNLSADVNISNFKSIKDIKCDFFVNTINDFIVFEIHKSLTLAILDGLNIRVGESMYILPMVNIVESINPTKENIKSIGDESKSILMLRDEFIPILKLYEYLDIEADNKDLINGVLIVLKYNQNKIAILIDEFLKQEKIVLRAIEENFVEVPEFLGSTIRGTGQIGLILNIKSLFAKEKKTLN